MGRTAGQTNAETKALVQAAWEYLRDKQPTAREVSEVAGVAVQTAAKHRPADIKDWTGEKPKDPRVVARVQMRPFARTDPEPGTRSAEIVAYLRTLPEDETTGDVARRFGTSTTLVMQLNRRYVPEWEPLHPKGVNKAERLRTAVTKMLLRRESWNLAQILEEAGQKNDSKSRAYARSVLRPLLSKAGVELAPEPEPLSMISTGVAAKIVAEWQEKPSLTIKQLTKRHGEFPDEVWEALRLWAHSMAP